MSLSEKSPVLIPYWVVRVLKRNSLSLSDVLDYNKIRNVLSIEDAADLLSLQHLYVAPFIDRNYFGRLLNSWEESASGDLKRELVSSVISLSYSEGSKESNLLRLNKDHTDDDITRFGNDTESSDKGQPAFELVDFDRNVFALILKPGFTEYVSTYKGQIELVTAMLKQLYVYYKVHKVSSTTLFDSYVKLLEGKVWGRVSA